jgi:prophage antirepressor-like protein
MDLLEKVFDSKNIKIVTTIMKGEFEEEITPYFCGRDVCNVFEYSKYRDVLSHIEEDCKITLGELVVQGGGTTSMVQDNLTYNELKTVYINEEGLYRLMFHCKLPVAKKFQKWIFKEVLPNIRKTGRFELRNTIKIKEEELAKAVEKLAIKDKEVEDAEERANQAEEARIKAERKSIRINKFMKRITIKERKLEWIYIATTKFYSQERMFKPGSTTRLSARIGPYNTGRPSEDAYYYCWVMRCYNSKDVDYHIQKLLADFKHRDNAELVCGIKFSDLRDIITFIVENYDASVDYINNFIRRRLNASLEEDDEPPPRLDCSKITYQIGDHTETINVEEEDLSVIRDEMDNILTTIQEQREGYIVVDRKELVNRLSKVTNAPKKDLWCQIKELTGWKDSKTEIDDGSFKYKIVY